ncbi:FAD-binding dehydrogenase [Gordonibacter sp. An230]|uniref:FAD-dependent oxidoreductase n=1 Tax=Gordonibacter sp. An230 TaxID=1965592 RepID=UPI000B375946|nr:FAD-dependent oxidoreductase [Gordonibacter sp. An230]OUO92139.1 FAD-binding dehydrogenase [Gordonibacter sp. An230]
MTKEKTANLSRRSFLTGTAAVGALAAAGALAGCAPQTKDAASEADAAIGAADGGASRTAGWLGEAPQISDDDCVETVECEVLVVGAGTSGYFAAASAAESGAKTLLIEKSAAGNSVRSSALGAVNSRLQKEQGERAAIEPAEIVNDMDRYALGQINARLVRAWALNSGEALDWYTDLMAENGIEVQLEWNMPEGTFYKDWPTGHGTNGEYPSREQDVAKVIDRYIASFDGCEVRFNCPMKKLIMEDGRVMGAYAEAKEGMIRINASKGVVVATGGYAYNQGMYSVLQPVRYSCLGTFDAFPTCTGDGIRALMWLGAQMDEVPTSLTFNRCLLTAEQEHGHPYEVGSDDYGYHFFASQPFLRVDAHGERFHNESAPYDFVMNAIAQRPASERYWHQVWDGNWKSDVPRFHTVGCSTIYMQPEGGSDHDAFPGQLDEWIAPEMEQFVEAGYLVKADTLEELADKLGFDADAKRAFLATCERQNENFDAREDPDFGKEAFRLSELRTPPFYASVKSCGLTLCTLDGIRVNDELQPFGEDGVPIEGVYVVGNDQGNFYAGTYPNLAAGINAGRCATFGRMVGKKLAGK